MGVVATSYSEFLVEYLRSAACCRSARCLPDSKTPKRHRAEFTKVAVRTGLGFIVMGFIGFFVKLILCVGAAVPQS